jgi:hypothetical protein
MLTRSIERKGAVTVVRLSGSLPGIVDPPPVIVNDLVKGFPQECGRNFVVDISGIVKLDAFYLSELVGFRKRVEDLGGGVAYVLSATQMDWLIDRRVAALISALPTFPSVDEAVASFETT